MLSVSWIKVCVLLVLFNHVLSDFEKMTSANMPGKLKGVMTFDGSLVYMYGTAEFDAKPSDGFFEFKFSAKCSDVIVKVKSHSLTVYTEDLQRAPSEDRTLIVSTKTGAITGNVLKGPLSMDPVEDDNVPLYVKPFVNCRVDLVRGTPLVDLSDGQLIGGLTKLQFSLAVVLPVAGAVIIAFSIFAIYKKVKSWQKKQEKQKLKKKEEKKAEKETDQKEEEVKSAEAEGDQEKEEKEEKKPKEDSLHKSRRRIHSEKESAVSPCVQPAATLEDKVREENAAKHQLRVDKLCAVITMAIARVKEKQLEKAAAPSKSKQDKVKLAEMDLELEKVKASLKASMKQKEQAEKKLKKVKKQMAAAERKRKSQNKPKVEGPADGVSEVEFQYTRCRVKDLVERQRPLVTPVVELKTAVEKEEPKKPKAATLKTAEENVEKVKKAATLKTAEEKVETARAKTRSRTRTVSCGQDEDLKVIDDQWDTDLAKKKASVTKQTTRTLTEGKEDDMAVLDDDYEGDMAKKAAAAAKKKKSRTPTDPSCCAPEDDMAVLDEDWRTAKKRKASTATKTTTKDPSQDPTGTLMGQTLSATLPDNSEERQKWKNERQKAADHRASLESEEPVIAKRASRKKEP